MTPILLSQTFLYALAGWLTGALINHAADILPTRRSVRRKPRCLTCQTPRPVWGWSGLLALGSGHYLCYRCGRLHPTHTRAVLVELATPVFFAFLFGRYGWSVQLGLLSVYTTILLLLTVTDLEHRLIFNVVILPAIGLGLITAFFTPGLSWKAALLGGAVAFGVVYLAALFSRGGLGGGDVTLSTFLGLIIGFPYILLSLTFGVFLGGFTALLLLLTRRVGMKTFIPYGPFLTITGWVMLIWHREIWTYYF